MLEVHDTTGYGEEAAASSLDAAADYWVSVKSALVGQEDYVQLNIGNEPFGNGSNVSNWTSETSAAIQKLRSNGLRNQIIVDAPNWGQDWSFTMRNNAATVFAADPDANTVFSVHMYGVFDTASEVKDYLAAFTSKNLPSSWESSGTCTRTATRTRTRSWRRPPAWGSATTAGRGPATAAASSTSTW